MNENIKNIEGTVENTGTNETKNGINFSSIENKIKQIESMIGDQRDGKEFFVKKMNKILESKFEGVYLEINNGKIQLKSDIGIDLIDEIEKTLENKTHNIDKNGDGNIDKKELNSIQINDKIEIDDIYSGKLLEKHQQEISMGNENYLLDLIFQKDGNDYLANFGNNTQLEYSIGLADIMPSNIKKVRVQGTFEGEKYDMVGTRNGTKGGFYDEKNNYLPVYHGFKVTIIEQLDDEQMEKINLDLEQKLSEFKNSEFFKKNKDIIGEQELLLIGKTGYNYNISPEDLVGFYKLTGEVNDKYLGLDSLEGKLSNSCKRIQNGIAEFKNLGGEDYLDSKGNLNPSFIIFIKQLYPSLLPTENKFAINTILNTNYNDNEINDFQGKISNQLTNLYNIYTNNGENTDTETVYGENLKEYSMYFDPRKIVSQPYEKSPSGITLCGKTARLNYGKFGGECPRGDAIKLFNDTDYNGGEVYNRAKCMNLLNSDFDGKGYYHITVAKNDGKYDENNVRNGHSFVVFRGTDGTNYVLDPYYFGGSQKPHKLTEHPFAYKSKYSNSKWTIYQG